MDRTTVLSTQVLSICTLGSGFPTVAPWLAIAAAAFAASILARNSAFSLRRAVHSDWAASRAVSRAVITSAPGFANLLEVACDSNRVETFRDGDPSPGGATFSHGDTDQKVQSSLPSD